MRPHPHPFFPNIAMLAGLERLLAELKRRHVLRMTGLYAVGAWVVVQVAATTFPYLGLPGWAVTVVIILAALGLPLTIALAWLFNLTDEGVERETGPARIAGPLSPRFRPILASLLVLALAATGLVALRRMRDTPANGLDLSLAAVMPFRVSGGDAGTAALGEGMVDLLAMRLVDENGVRAADARSAVAAWRRAGGENAADPVASALAAARSLGAGRVITGSIVVAGREVTIGATLLRTDRPQDRSHTGDVRGPIDSLLHHVDRLTVALLARDAGLDQHRISDITSLPALQAFLAGKAAHRRGRYRDAIGHYQDALQIDSTFALAALALNTSARRSPEQFELAEPAMALAHRHAAELSERDRALLRAFSPQYPDVSSILEVIAAFEEMLARWSDDADAWFELGDNLLHWGLLSGIPDAVPKSERAFHRAIALDSSFYLPAEHLLAAALERQDGELIRLMLPHVRAIGGAAARIDYLLWRVALALGDSAAVRAVSARLDSVDAFSRNAIAGDAQWLGERIEDAERATAITISRAATSAELRDAHRREHDLALNRGMLQRAQAALNRAPMPPLRRDFTFINDALFAAGDTAAAEDAAARLRGRLSARGSDTLPRWQRASVECQLAWWDLARERTDSALARRQRLRTGDTDDAQAFSIDDVVYCHALIDATMAARRQQPDVRALLARADSINIHSATTLFEQGNRITARLHEQTGDVRGALALLQRVRVGTPDLSNPYIATHHHEVARLALLAGDTALAREHLRRYLALRSKADPALQPELARARTTLAAITAEPRR